MDWWGSWILPIHQHFGRLCMGSNIKTQVGWAYIFWCLSSWKGIWSHWIQLWVMEHWSHLHKGGITAVSKLMPSQNVSYNFCPCRIIRPNTLWPYWVLNIESTIISGGLFYSFSNINQSCIGVFQSFLAASNSHQLGVFKTSRLLLSWMLI